MRRRAGRMDDAKVAASRTLDQGAVERLAEAIRAFALSPRGIRLAELAGKPASRSSWTGCR